MSRAWRGAMPLLLTLPLRLERRPRARRRRLRRLAFGALLALGVALIAVGLWLPAKGSAAPSASTVRGDAQLRSLAIGDELELEQPDGAIYLYEVAALDVVDAQRVQLGRDADESTVLLVTCWPFDAVDVAGRWHYVVTARRVGLVSAAAAHAASF